MTRLSLHSRDETLKLSIRLRVGQYCTVGSTAAADYWFRSAGVEPVHCRIVCRASGGFAECVNPAATININGRDRDRCRLVNGDRLAIGQVEFLIEMPEVELLPSEFNFEDEAAPTTKVAGSLRYDRVRPHDGDDQGSDSDFAEPADFVGHAEPFTDESLSLEVALPQSSAQQSEESNPDSESESRTLAKPELETKAEPANAEPVNAEPARAEAINAEAEASAEPASDPPIATAEPGARTMTFEFDSADTSDIDFDESDLEALQDPESFHVEGTVDLEAEAEAKLESQSLGRTKLADAVDAGKHWKWTGERAVAAFQQLIQRDHSLQIFRTEQNSLVPVNGDDVDLAWCRSQAATVLLLSAREPHELTKLTRQRRWEDRLEHPQAVTMFLALSPKRIVVEFFELIPACLLIHENEIELLRGDDSLA